MTGNRAAVLTSPNQKGTARVLMPNLLQGHRTVPRVLAQSLRWPGPLLVLQAQNPLCHDILLAYLCAAVPALLSDMCVSRLTHQLQACGGPSTA